MDTALLIFPHFSSLSSFNTLPRTSYPLVSNSSLHRPSRATIQPSTPNSTPSKQTPIWAWQAKKTITPLPVSDSVRPKLVKLRYTLIEPENVHFSFSGLYPSPFPLPFLADQLALSRFLFISPRGETGPSPPCLHNSEQ